MFDLLLDKNLRDSCTELLIFCIKCLFWIVYCFKFILTNMHPYHLLLIQDSHISQDDVADVTLWVWQDPRRCSRCTSPWSSPLYSSFSQVSSSPRSKQLQPTTLNAVSRNESGTSSTHSSTWAPRLPCQTNASTTASTRSLALLSRGSASPEGNFPWSVRTMVLDPVTDMALVILQVRSVEKTLKIEFCALLVRV